MRVAPVSACLAWLTTWPSWPPRSQERLAAANSRLHEAKVEGVQLKQQLGKYQRALAREVGEDVPVAKLLDEASGAKGRAQQISLLKEQVKSLKGKLATVQGDDGPASPDAEGRQRGALQVRHDAQSCRGLPHRAAPLSRLAVRQC